MCVCSSVWVCVVCMNLFAKEVSMENKIDYITKLGLKYLLWSWVWGIQNRERKADSHTEQVEQRENGDGKGKIYLENVELKCVYNAATGWLGLCKDLATVNFNKLLAANMIT